MRLKAIILTTIVTSIVSIGLQTILFYVLNGCVICGLMESYGFKSPRFTTAHLIATITFFLPIFAGFFIYRHTSKRRKLQAFITFLLSIVVTIAGIFLLMIVF
jgi:4-amino-4-deoxy-L-arabinose transferase-like glycosyltransferase